MKRKLLQNGYFYLEKVNHTVGNTGHPNRCLSDRCPVCIDGLYNQVSTGLRWCIYRP